MKKIIIGMCLIFTMLLLVSCGSNTATQTVTQPKEGTSALSATALSAEKINEITADFDKIDLASGGIIYKVGDKYGIMSFDGKHDSGAVYDYCKQNDNLFEVITDIPDDKSEHNLGGLVDSSGNVILPEEYASFNVLNDRYIKACKVTGETNSKDDALIYESDNWISVGPGDGDKLYTGNWCVYDRKEKSMIKGASGTKAYTISAHGNTLSYVTDAEEKIHVNSEGTVLPKDATVYDDGSYSVRENDTSSVYDDKGDLLFTFSNDTLSLLGCDVNTGYFIASEKDSGKSNNYVVLDRSGKKISAEFSDNIKIFNEYILSQNKVYDFEGNSVLEGNYENAYIDNMTKSAVLFEKESGGADLIINGDVITLDGTDNDNKRFVFGKKNGDKTVYYCLKDKDYTINGYSLGKWIVKSNTEEYKYNLIDTISGETLIKDYTEYTYAYSDGTDYVCAKKDDKTYDIYAVKCK